MPRPEDHPAYWLLRNLFSKTAEASWFINLRAIVNVRPYEKHGTTHKGETKVIFNENVLIKDFKQRWESLLLTLTEMNLREVEPANIYFGINPRKDTSNKVDSVTGYQTFGLDLDDNKNYTKQQRLIQLDFWSIFGLPVSAAVDSGHGYHAYWMFLGLLLDKEWGQQTLKRMVAITGCRDKGNTHDSTRVLRLPGFYNVKNWWEGDMPFCSLITPVDHIKNPEAVRYDPAVFERFPLSELAQIEEYHQRATALNPAIPIQERVRQLAQQAAEIAWQQKTTQDAREIAMVLPDPSASLDHQQKNVGPVVPKELPTLKLTLNIVPPLDSIQFIKRDRWMKIYCERGYEGLNKAEIEKIGKTINLDSFSASELDYRVMYRLVTLGYTKDAIVEFWQRNGIKLYRPAKMQKCPNYIDMTFDSCLGAANAALQQGRGVKGDHQRLISNPDNTITATPQGLIIKRSEDRDDLILTANMELMTRYHDEDADSDDAREFFDLKIKGASPNGPIHYEKLVPVSAFTEIKNFHSEVSMPFVRLLTGHKSELQAILYWLESKHPNVKTKKFNSKAMFRNGAFNFPQMSVTADKIELKEDTLVHSALMKKYPIYSWFTPNYYSKEQATELLRKNWEALLHVHLPRLVISTIGLIGGAALAVILRSALELEDFHIPTLNVRGNSNSGKTETVRTLLKLSGMSKFEKGNQSTNITTFAMQRLLGCTNFVPVLFDEFKLNASGSNAKSLEILRATIRQNYSGETVLRGRANLSLMSFSMHAPVVIVGEHQFETPGDLSEVSRIVSVATDTYMMTAEKTKRADHLKSLRWEWLAPLFYQFVLTLDPGALYKEYVELKWKVTDQLKNNVAESLSRVSHNLAVLYMGCRLYDRFVQALLPGAATIEKTLNIDANLIAETGQGYVEQEHTFKAEVTDGFTGEKRTVVLSNNEFFRMLQVVQTIESVGLEMKDFPDCGYRESTGPAGTLLLLHLETVYERYKAYSQRFSKPVPPFEKMKALLHGMEARHEPWLIKRSESRSIVENAGKKKVAIFNLTLLREMGVWTLPPNKEYVEKTL